MEIADNTGKLQVVAFDKECDTFYPQFTAGEIYTLEKAAVKTNPFATENYVTTSQIQLSKFSKVTLN